MTRSASWSTRARICCSLIAKVITVHECLQPPERLVRLALHGPDGYSERGGGLRLAHVLEEAQRHTGPPPMREPGDCAESIDASGDIFDLHSIDASAQPVPDLERP